MNKAQLKRRQKARKKVAIWTSLAVFLTAIIAVYLYNTPMAVLDPAGPIARGEKDLLVFAFLMMVPVVVLVFAIAFSFAWRYRESNTNAKYTPEWDSSKTAEAIWWFIPSVLIFVLAIATWHGTFKYDPYKPLASADETLTVQVVALDWRWLFIYPEQKVASVNELRLPVDTPVKFEITSDAPMNSFWIPQLGGQVYAMPGMGTNLHLQADRTGEFYGSAANISGEGFAGMNFMTVVSEQDAFNGWVKESTKAPALTNKEYNQLALKSTDRRVYTFSRPANGLYDTIISKYMNTESMHHDLRKEGN